MWQKCKLKQSIINIITDYQTQFYMLLVITTKYLTFAEYKTLIDGPVKNVPYHTLTSTNQLCPWLSLASLIQNSDPYCMAYEQHSQSWLVGAHILALAPP